MLPCKAKGFPKYLKFLAIRLRAVDNIDENVYFESFRYKLSVKSKPKCSSFSSHECHKTEMNHKSCQSLYEHICTPDGASVTATDNHFDTAELLFFNESARRVYKLFKKFSVHICGKQVAWA